MQPGFPKNKNGLVCLDAPVISALGKLREDDQELEASLGLNSKVLSKIKK